MGSFNLINPANQIWNGCMTWVKVMLGATPMHLADGNIWDKVIAELYPIFATIGSSLLMTFLFVGFLKEIMDFRKNITLELLVTYGIRIIVANILLLNVVPLAQRFFWSASQLAYTTFNDFSYTFVTPDNPQIGEFLSYFVVGIAYIIAAFVCGFSIVFTLYKRYLNLYLMVLMAPVALSSMAGDRGISQTAAAWFKNFLAATFEIVVISLALVISGWMLSAGLVVFSGMASGLAAWMMQLLEGLLNMVITAGAVKGAEGLLKKVLAL